MQEWEKPDKPGLAVLMRGFPGTDLYKCILYGYGLRFAGARLGTHATEWLSKRLPEMEKKRWLRIPALEKCA